MTEHLGDRISPLIDHQLGHDARDRALAHLTHCAECQREVAALRRLKSRLVGLGGPDLPGDVADRLLRMSAGGPPVRPSMPGRPGAGARPARPAVAAWTAAPPTSVDRPPVDRPAVDRPPVDRPPVTGQRPAGPPRWYANPSDGRTDLFFSGAAAAAPMPSGHRGFEPVGAPWSNRPPVLPRMRVRSPLIGPGHAPGPGRAPGRPGGTAPPGYARDHGRRPPALARQRRGTARTSMRRAIVGSAALMLIALTGAALGDGRGVARTPGPVAVPTVSSVVSPPAPAGGSARPTPMLAPMAVSLRR